MASGTASLKTEGESERCEVVFDHPLLLISEDLISTASNHRKSGRSPVRRRSRHQVLRCFRRVDAKHQSSYYTWRVLLSTLAVPVGGELELHQKVKVEVLIFL